MQLPRRERCAKRGSSGFEPSLLARASINREMFGMPAAHPFQAAHADPVRQLRAFD
ncbi:hypothetical protein [Burkholderia catarinensis]|uniref:hypothetical protein n=1 Tax=Burkholderia catarinensis TaxID=1108140 RepID=UPI001301085E|nr:hypothetical protein [Burkholderia catarinensis]